MSSTGNQNTKLFILFSRKDIKLFIYYKDMVGIQLVHITTAIPTVIILSLK